MEPQEFCVLGSCHGDMCLSCWAAPYLVSILFSIWKDPRKRFQSWGQRVGSGALKWKRDSSVMPQLSSDSRRICVLAPGLLGQGFQIVPFGDPHFSAVPWWVLKGGEGKWVGEKFESHPAPFLPALSSSFQALPKFPQELLAP